MSEGLTFPANPYDGQTITQTFTHTGGDAGNRVMVRRWSWNESRGVWVTNTGLLTDFVETFIGIVSGNSRSDLTVAKWDYFVFPADYNGSSDKWEANGQSRVTAQNLYEMTNTNDLIYGSDATGAAGLTFENFSGFGVTPVPDNLPVEVYTISSNYFFSAPNPINGDC